MFLHMAMLIIVMVCIYEFTIKESHKDTENTKCLHFTRNFFVITVYSMGKYGAQETQGKRRRAIQKRSHPLQQFDYNLMV